jgi:hypothetical protein
VNDIKMTSAFSYILFMTVLVIAGTIAVGMIALRAVYP